MYASRTRAVATVVIALVGATSWAQTPTAEEIVRRLEAHRTPEDSRAVIVMTIEDRFGTRTSELIAYQRGETDTLLEFTSAAERGQKVLRTESELYLFYPDAAELIRLQGAALRDSMVGSDVSYEDLTGGRSLLEDYRAESVGIESIDGNRTYVVELRARGRNVAYPRQRLWIDAESFVARRTELSASSGRLLKTIEVEQIEIVAGRPYPVDMVIADALRRGSSTRVETIEIQIDTGLDAERFSLDSLQW